MTVTDMTGLYVHIPYCRRKCNYCDFCSVSQGCEPIPDEYIDALCEELSYYGLTDRVTLSTVYFGGGTPSLLSCEQLEKLMSEIRNTFDIADGAEITTEANPGTLTQDKIEKLSQLGFNRISLGLQSIHENEMKTLGRIHSFEDFLCCFKMLRDAGFDNISVDLMYGIPHQNTESFEETLCTVCELSPEHISAYGLILEEHTPLYHMAERLPMPTEDDECDMYESACRILREYGYLHYEISNYAKEGKESRHNLIYWHSGEYIGVGASAHSFFGGRRYANIPDVDEYIAAPVNIGGEDYENSIDDRKFEYAMLALRLSEGMSLDGYRKAFGESFEDGREEKLSKFESIGLLGITEDRIFLTEKGFYLSNTVLSEIL